MTCLIALVVVTGLCVASGSAQILPENHYLIYETPYAMGITGDIELYDQFGALQFTYAEFDLFANPVEKDYEPYWDYGAHQTWYLIDQPLTDEWRVDLNNQFGTQRWFVRDAHYLVLPAEKTMPSGPPPTYEHNHYLCYEVIQAPTLDIDVTLHDQFLGFSTTVVRPLYFCNPCEKMFNGVWYPMVDDQVHLAVYLKFQPNPLSIPG